MRISKFAILILFFSFLNFAQAGHWPDQYDGSVIDIGQIHKPSERYPLCDKYAKQHSSDPKDNDTNAYRSCERGNLEAQRMAERFGAGNGEVLGLLMGYVRGISNAFEGSKNKDEYIKLGEQGVTGDFKRALQAGKDAARGEANSLAQSDVIEKFRRAVDTGEEPDASYSKERLQEKVNLYPGLSDGYRREGHQSKGEKDILNDAVRNLGQTPIFHDVDGTTFEDLNDIDFWSLFDRRGEAKNFAEYGWNNSRRAWSVWLTLPDTSKAEYQNLEESFVMVPAERWETDPETGERYKVIYEKKVVIYTRNEIQEVWQEGFQGSYGFYVSHYFALNYHKNLQRGYQLGLALGGESGKIYAMQVGKIREFNRKYQETSKEGYRAEFLKEYEEVFASVFDDYINHPKLEITGVTFIGKKEDDGIYMPGEEIRAQVNVTNLGGVGKNVTLRFVGDIEPGSDGAENQEVRRLHKEVLNTDFLARIDKRLPAQSNAQVGVSVDGIVRYAQFEVNKLAEIASVVITSLNPVYGTGQVRVFLTNPSKTRTPSSLVLRVSVPDLKTFERSIPALEAGTKRHPVDVTFDGLDPLVLIDRGELEVHAALYMDQEELHQGRDRSNVEKRPNLASYFHVLINKQLEDYGQADYEIRTGEVTDRIVSEVQNVVAQNKNNAIWEKNPLSTMVGQVAHKYKTQSFSQNQSVKTQAQALYQNLGQTVWPLRDKLSKGGTRKSYSKVVMEFSPGIEKKKLKK